MALMPVLLKEAGGAVPRAWWISGCASLTLSFAEPASQAAIKAEAHLSDRTCSKAAGSEVVIAVRSSSRWHREDHHVALTWAKHGVIRLD